MPIPQAIVTRYFQHIANKELAEAEHELELIKLDVHFIISEHEFENVRQLLSKGQYAETEQEITRLKEVLANKRLSIVQREFESYKRGLGRQPAGIQQVLGVIANLIVNKQFIEAGHEVGKLEQLLVAKDFSEAISALKKFRRVLVHKQFTETAADLDMLKQLISSRQFARAEHELEKFKQRKRRAEWDRGYFRALYGMYLSRKSNGDNYTLFSKLDFSDRATLHAYRREFLEHTKSGLHADFDKGYFLAWADCLRIITRMDIPSPQSSNDNVGSEKERIETLKSDKSQATMANFFQKDEEK